MKAFLKSFLSTVTVGLFLCATCVCVQLSHADEDPGMGLAPCPEIACTNASSCSIQTPIFGAQFCGYNNSNVCTTGDYQTDCSGCVQCRDVDQSATLLCRCTK